MENPNLHDDLSEQVSGENGLEKSATIGALEVALRNSKLYEEAAIDEAIAAAAADLEEQEEKAKSGDFETKQPFRAAVEESLNHINQGNQLSPSSSARKKLYCDLSEQVQGRSEIERQSIIGAVQVAMRSSATKDDLLAADASNEIAMCLVEEKSSSDNRKYEKSSPNKLNLIDVDDLEDVHVPTKNGKGTDTYILDDEIMKKKDILKNSSGPPRGPSDKEISRMNMAKGYVPNDNGITDAHMPKSVSDNTHDTRMTDVYRTTSVPGAVRIRGISHTNSDNHSFHSIFTTDSNSQPSFRVN